jgi:hypothetical protein
MSAILNMAVFALLWGIVLVRLPTVLRDPRQRALWATCFTLALCKTTALPSINARLAELADGAQLMPHFFGVACVFFLLRFMSLVTDVYTTRARAATYQIVAVCVVVPVLIGLSVLSPNGIQAHNPNFTVAPLPVVAYWTVLEAYLGGILAAATVLFWRMSRAAPAGALRTGLRCIAAGLLLNVLYALHRVVVVAMHAWGAAVPTDVVSPAFDRLRAAGAILALAGALVPATERIRSVARTYRSLRALHALWRAMRQAFPAIILFTPRRALLERFGVHDVHLRLYRRVIEIRDGMLALRSYLPTDSSAEANTYLDSVGSVCPDRDALVEACRIELALHCLRSDQRWHGSDNRWADVGADLADEVRWMRKVSGCLLRDEPVGFVAWWTERRRDDGKPVAGEGLSVETRVRS